MGNLLDVAALCSLLPFPTHSAICLLAACSLFPKEPGEGWPQTREALNVQDLHHRLAVEETLLFLSSSNVTQLFPLPLRGKPQHQRSPMK